MIEARARSPLDRVADALTLLTVALLFGVSAMTLSALGVAYGLFIGIIVHLIVLIVWLAIRKSKLRKAEFIVLLLSFFIMIVLAVISDDGSLSKMAGLSHYHGLIGA